MSKIVTLDEIAEIKTGPFGTQFKASEYTKQGIPVINVKNIGYGNIVKSDLDFVNETTVERLSEHVLQKDDIVFGRKGSVDRHCIIRDNETGWLQGSDCIRVRIVSKAVNPLYVSYYLSLRCIKDQLSNSAVGSTMPSMNSQIIKNIAIKCPEKELQDKIAELLESINKKIEINRDIVMELDNAVKAIYDHWFLQYDFPDENGKPYKSSGGKMVWNEELKREIPVGWRVGTIETIGDVVGGGTPSTKHTEYYCKEGIGWITPYDLANTTDKYIAHGQRDITEEGIKKSSAKLLPRGTVLMTSRAPIGYLAIASEAVCTNQGFKSIVPKSGFGSEFVYYTILNAIPYIKSLGTGSTFTEVSKEVVSEVKIVVPPKEIHQSFENSILKFSMQIRVLEGERRELSSLRDFLLPLLMNGQIGFRERQ